MRRIPHLDATPVLGLAVTPCTATMVSLMDVCRLLAQEKVLLEGTTNYLQPEERSHLPEVLYVEEPEHCGRLLHGRAAAGGGGGAVGVGRALGVAGGGAVGVEEQE